MTCLGLLVWLIVSLAACEQIKQGDLDSLQKVVENAIRNAGEDTGCPERPASVRKRCLEQRAEQAEQAFRQIGPDLDQRLAAAQDDPAGFVEALQDMPLTDLVRPVNARLDAFEARLALKRLQEQARGTGSRGVAFALNRCYVEQGDVVDTKDGACRFEGETVPPKPLQMVAAVPLGGDGEPVLSYVGGRRNLLEFITFDPNRPDGQDIYLFGDPRFNTLYLTALTSRLDTVSELLSGVSKNSILGAAVFALDCELGLGALETSEEETFLCTFGKLLKQASEGGGVLVDRVASALFGTSEPAAEPAEPSPRPTREPVPTPAEVPITADPEDTLDSAAGPEDMTVPGGAAVSGDAAGREAGAAPGDTAAPEAAGGVDGDGADGAVGPDIGTVPAGTSGSGGETGPP